MDYYELFTELYNYLERLSEELPPEMEHLQPSLRLREEVYLAMGREEVAD